MTVRVSLLASAITAMIREDPTLFVAQASRRYLPSHVRDALGRLAEHTPSSAVRHALALVSDRPDLSSEATHSTSGSRSRARRLWDLGDVPGALATLDPHDSLARRLAEEWQLLQSSPASSARRCPLVSWPRSTLAPARSELRRN